MENPNDNLNGQALSKRERRLLKKQRIERASMLLQRRKKIKKILFISLLILLLMGIIVFFVQNYTPEKNQSGNAPEKPKITVFYSPTCSCCKEYLSYLRKNGFEVEEKPTRDMLSVKEKYQIHSEMESCHTSIIGDYFVEGHIPVEVIKKLLEEKLEIDGIALPGMPPGSPGMEGFKTVPFKIYSLKNGQHSEFLSW